MSALDKKKIRSFARGILSKSKEIDLLQVLVLSVSTAQNLKIALVSGKFQGCTSFWEERLEYTNLHRNVGIYIQRPGDPNMQRLPPTQHSSSPRESRWIGDRAVKAQKRRTAPLLGTLTDALIQCGWKLKSGDGDGVGGCDRSSSRLAAWTSV